MIEPVSVDPLTGKGEKYRTVLETADKTLTLIHIGDTEEACQVWRDMNEWKVSEPGEKAKKMLEGHLKILKGR